MLDKYLNKIVLGDCLDVLRELPDNCVDLVLTDPPYGIGYDKSISKQGGTQYGNAAAKKRDYHTSDWDNSIPEGEVFEQILRVGTNAIIFGGNYFTEHLPPSRGWIVWNKETGGNNFSDCELAWTNYDKPLNMFTYMWNGMLQQDMANKEHRIHPTQKPRQLFMQILEKYMPFDLDEILADGHYDEEEITRPSVLDPFSGSGTTALACHDLGYDYICIEKDKDYYEASVKRLEDHQRQGRLF